jgi:hypothetical protein
LGHAGYTHSLQDILDEIKAGTMQSFVSGNSWAVTCILDTPRRRVLEIFMVVGALADLVDLEAQVIEFAKNNGVTLVRAYGRQGWLKVFSQFDGWKPKQTVFIKEI